MTASNPLGDGEARFCDDCGDAYREANRLPGDVGLCPPCFEDRMNGGS